MARFGKVFRVNRKKVRYYYSGGKKTLYVLGKYGWLAVQAYVTLERRTGTRYGKYDWQKYV